MPLGPEPHLVPRPRPGGWIATAPGSEPCGPLLAATAVVERGQHRRVVADLHARDPQVVVGVAPQDRGDVADRRLRPAQEAHAAPRGARRVGDEPAPLHPLRLARARHVARVDPARPQPKERAPVRVLERVPQEDGQHRLGSDGVLAGHPRDQAHVYGCEAQRAAPLALAQRVGPRREGVETCAFRAPRRQPSHDRCTPLVRLRGRARITRAAVSQRTPSWVRLRPLAG
jgi:hypothetical protein